MSTAQHIADNYNETVNIITSLIWMYEKNVQVEVNLEKAREKQSQHTQMAKTLYTLMLTFIHGVNAEELRDLKIHFDHLIRTIEKSFEVDPIFLQTLPMRQLDSQKD